MQALDGDGEVDDGEGRSRLEGQAGAGVAAGEVQPEAGVVLQRQRADGHHSYAAFGELREGVSEGAG